MTNFNVLQNNLEELSLFKMNEILPNVIEKSVKSNTALQDSLIELTGAEIAFRDERARKINVTVSHFPYIKTVKDFDFSYQPTINKEQIMDFLSLRFIEQKSNIIFVGSSGVGKTHLATAIGIEAASKRKIIYRKKQRRRYAFFVYCSRYFFYKSRSIRHLHKVVLFIFHIQQCMGT